MARDHANIQTGIWGHPDVRALPPLQQWLYLQVWTHPDLSYVGVLEWRPGKIAQLSEGSTPEFVSELVPLLQQRLFFVVDPSTEEVLVRSYLRWDGLLKQPKLSVSMTNAYAATGSNLLRGVIVHELQKLREEFPEWHAWSVPQVVSIMKHPAIDAAELPIGLPLALPSPLPQSLPKGLGLRTATATTTATASPVEREKLTRLPTDWVPSSAHFDLAKTRGVNIAVEAEAFRLHAETYDRRAARWNSAFTTWLKKSKPSAPKASEAWMNA